MMRPLLLLALFLLPAAAADDAQLERLAIARLGFDARMRLADLLRADGERKETLARYARAVEFFGSALDAAEARVEPAGAAKDVERLRLLRLAMAAQIRIGDTLLEKRDREGAWLAYEEALRLEIRPARGGAAVNLALKWLASHQDPDGRWDCDDFMKHDPKGDKCTGPGGANYDIGVTGLAVLAFLRTGHTDGAPVQMGLEFLRKSQEENGCFGTRVNHSFMYGHAIATLAFSEAYGLTRDAKYKKPAQDGLKFLAMARNPYLAWRYDPRGGENDTSVTGWCVMALAAGKAAGLDVDSDAFDGAGVWIDKMTEPNFGQTGYLSPGGTPARPEGKQDKFPPEKSHSMTAVAISARMAMGEDPRTSDMVRKGAKLCLELPPVWAADGSIDMYYWFHGTEAMARIGGDAWTKWRGALEEALLKNQNPAGSGARAGSWDPAGPWGDDGGRVYSTALMALSLAAEPADRTPRAGPR